VVGIGRAATALFIAKPPQTATWVGYAFVMAYKALGKIVSASDVNPHV
jgi:hypothetical protein